MWSHTRQDPLSGGPALQRWTGQASAESASCEKQSGPGNVVPSASGWLTVARRYPGCSALETGSALVCALSPCELVACHDLPATGETPMHKSPGGDPKLTWDFNFIGSVLSAHCAADAGLINTHARETWAHLFSDLCSLYVQVHAVLCQRKMTT